MRILILTDNFYPSRAACAVRMKVFVEKLQDHGHYVHVLASDSNVSEGDEFYRKPDYVSFFPVYPLKEKTTINRLRNNLSGVFGAISASRGLGKFDYVICTSPPLLLSLAAVNISKRCGARLVFDVRDIWPDVAYEMGSFTRGGIYGKVFSRIANRAYKSASIITTVSPGKVSKIQNRINGDPQRVKLVPNGLDVSFLNQAIDDRVVAKYHLDRGPICCYVGNVGLAQGLGSIFQLAEHRQDVRFLVFGDGAERADLEARAIKQGLGNIEFCGTLGSNGVYTVLKYANVSFAPLVSSKLTDSIPTKIFESVGCGCPVLLAAVGDSADLLEELNLGASAAPEDIDSLKQQLDKLLNQPYSIEERRSAANYVATHHSRQHAVDALECVLVRELGK